MDESIRLRRPSRISPRSSTTLLRRALRGMLAWILLGVARAATLTMPFERIARLLGPVEGGTAPAVPGPQTGRAAWIGHVTSRAADRTPWNSTCYPQALAVAAQLRMVGIPHTTSFGLRRSDGSLEAHAWVSVSGHPVVGGDVSPYTEVGTFAWQPRRRVRSS